MQCQIFNLLVCYCWQMQRLVLEELLNRKRVCCTVNCIINYASTSVIVIFFSYASNISTLNSCQFSLAKSLCRLALENGAIHVNEYD